MTSNSAPRATTTGARDQSESQGIAHNRIATRSRLALPEFNVEFDRSPLKNAREALRRANARFGKSVASVGSSTGEGPEGKVDAKMSDVLTRVNTNAASNPFRPTAAEKDDGSELGKEPKEKGDTDEEEVVRQCADRMDGSTSTLQPPANPFDDANDGHPKYPKRARSSSFDENTPPSPSGLDHGVRGMHVSRATPPLSPSRRPVSIDSTTRSSLEPGTSASSTSAVGSNNPKRAKLGKHGTLDTFFARPSSSTLVSSQAKEEQPQSRQRDASPSRRFFSEASPRPSSQPDSTFTPPTGNKVTQVEEAIVYPKTPTLKHLRELPSLDLRKITPSHRKPTLKIGLGTPGRKQPLKARAVSEGSALSVNRASEEVKEEDVPEPEIKEKRGLTQEAREHKEDAELLQSQPHTPETPPPSKPLTSSEEKPITMEVDADSRTAESGNAETQATAENALPSIIVSTSTGTIASAASPLKENLKPETVPPVSLLEVDNPSSGDGPSTPQDKILPSKPLPSGRVPSTKSHLSHLLSLSPLTPLSALGPLRENSDEYDHVDDEKAVREEADKAASTKAAKLAMQEEAEADANNEDISATPKPLRKLPKMGSLKGSSPALAGVTRKGSNKGKNKAKLLSTTSRLSTGVSGIKKRGSFASVSGGLTPRMRMTRAAVLRQKAIQARTPVRTPKDTNKRRTSVFATSVSSTVRKFDGKDTQEELLKGGSSNDTTKQSEQQKKTAEPGPQQSPRKTFVITVPSSLSPRKSRSASSSADSSSTLKYKPLESGPSKPFTFSLYPPSLNDTATTEQAQRALHKLSSALDKLNMPPPPKPSGTGAQLKRPMSEQRECIRPATSLGFTRESSVPVSMSQSKEMMGRSRATSRAGSAEPTKKSFFPPPPPPSFGASLQRDRSKRKALASSSRTAPVAFGSSNGGPASQIRPSSSFRFGLGAGGGTTGIFQRPVHRIRASQKPSLETVQGSPVKGGNSQSLAEDDEDEIAAVDANDEQRDTSADADASASSSNANGDTSASSTEGGDTPGAKIASDGTSMNGKELKKISRLNASRRASMAFTALAESLGTSPDMFSPFGVKQPSGSKGPQDEKTPTGITNNNEDQATNPLSSNSSRPVRAAAPRSFGFNAIGLGRTQSESSVNRSARARSVTPSGPSESDNDDNARLGSKKGGGGATWRSKMEGSYDALNHCVVFVDVKSEEGEDAGVLFVDMLRALGAKVLSSVGQTLTHIVYKNGMTSTLNRYRLLDEPRPKVVRINWVVECAETKAHVDETRFLIDLENVNIAGALKRRRSFLPKQIASVCTSGPMDTFLNGSTGETSRGPHLVPKACADSDATSEDGDTSQERVILSGGSLTSNMHPLERARKRNATNAR